MHRSDISSNLKILALVLPVLAVVLVSGCTGTGGGVSTGNGIVIEEFKPSLSEINSGQPITLLLKIENRGEGDAEDVEATIFGINTDEWDVYDEEKDLGDMLGVDSYTSTPGATKQAQWNAEAPQLPQQLYHTYAPMVRVSYDYSTTSHKPITIVDRDELVSLLQSGESLPHGSTTYTAGPLSVAVTATDYTVSPDESGIDPFNLNIIITNLWWGSNGRVVHDSFGDSDDAYPLEMKITLPDELDFTSAGSEQPGCSESWDDISLWDGHTGEITCELEIDDEPEIRTEGLIRVDLRYRFAVDSSTTVKVTGTSAV